MHLRGKILTLQTGGRVVMEKCLLACSINSGKFNFTNWKKEDFYPSHQNIVVLFFSLILLEKKVAFPSETEKLELSALSLGENNIYCRSTGILQAVNSEGFTHLADPIFADALLFSGTRKAINSSIAPHQEHS